jgi:hypothetical protein
VADDDEPKTRSERPSKLRPLALDSADTEPAVAARASAPSFDAARRYNFGPEIARGGMGRVVEATDTVLGRKVALKAALASEPESLRRFARETQVTARLEHPSIIPVYDAGKTVDGVPFYVMRKVAGRPLSELVKERRTIDERLGLLPNVLAAVDAVAHAHGRGVLHRDLKPANILVGELGETVVIDWGLAKIIDDVPDEILEEPDAADDPLKTRAGQVVGTPGFMAPEQLRGEPATRACDVYALGGTLYHVLAGEPPHASRSSDETIALALSGPPRAIGDLVEGVPGDLVTILERAMAYDAAQRYPDGAALAAELRRFLTGQLVASHEYSTVERLIRFLKRYRAAVVVTLIALAALAIVGYVSFENIVRERNAADRAREQAVFEAKAAEAARASEADRADDLLIEQAAALIATNPTAAVGLLHRLPPTAKKWRKARDVLAEARSRGVPWAFPASGFTSGLVLARDGKLAYSAGGDGVVRVHDLDSHATKTLVRVAENPRLALVGDKLLAIAAGRTLTWMYPETGAKDTVTLEQPADELVAAGTRVVLHDGRSLWIVGHGDRAPEKIELGATKIFGLEASPDGTRVVVNAQPEAVIVELAGVPRVAMRRPSRSMEPAWSADGKRLAIASLRGLDEIDFTSAPVTRSIATADVKAAAYAGEDLYFTTQTASYRYHPRDGAVQLDLPAATYTSTAVTRDGVILVGASGLVTLAGRGGTLALRVPALRASSAVALPQSTRFLLTVGDHLLLYDAAALLPRMFDAPLANTSFHGFTGTGHFLLSYMEDDWKQLDVATGESRLLGRFPFATVIDAPADGSYVIVKAQRGFLVLAPGKPPMELASATHAIAVSPTRIVYATAHDVIGIDLGPNRRTTLWSTKEDLRGLRGNGAFVVALANKQLWRSDGTTTTTPPWAAPPQAATIDPAGNTWLAVEASVWKWSVDGTLARVGQVAKRIHGLSYVAGAGCVAFDDRRGATVITESGQRSAVPSGYELRVVADSVPLGAGLTHDNRLLAYDLDPSSNHFWSVGFGEQTAKISADGHYLATFANGQLAIYTLELPADRTGYEAWLDATTNARLIDGSTELVWPR